MHLSILWRDFFASLAACFLALCIVMVVLINDPVKSKDEEAPKVGALMVVMTWPDGMPVDIDMWVQCPHERPIGYSSKSNARCDYLRDDLGNMADLTKANYEVIVSRGLHDGEYCINAHYFNGTVPDVPVAFEITINDGHDLRKIAATNLVLPAKGAERTAICLSIRGGKFIPDSVHNRYRPLRAAQQPG